MPPTSAARRGGAATLGLVGAAIGIGFTLGQPIGGLLAGKDPQHADFVAPAVVSTALSLLAILVVRFVLPESHAAAVRSPSTSHGRRGAWHLLRERPGLARLAASTLAVTYSQAILESIFALWALQRYGYGPRTVGFLLFGVALPALIMQGGLVRVLAPRFGEARLAMWGVLAYVAGLITLSQGATLGVTIAGLLLCGAGLGAYNPSAFALASRQSRGHDRGAVVGAYVASGSLARVIGPSPPAPCSRCWQRGTVSGRGVRDVAGGLAGAPRACPAGGDQLERNLDGAIDDTHRVRGQGHHGRRSKHTAVADIEGGTVQRTHQAR